MWPGFSSVLGKLGWLGRVGEVLGFEAEAAALDVFCAALAGEGAVEEVAGVELDAGFGGLRRRGRGRWRGR